MKTLNVFIFARKKLKIYIGKTKNIIKLEIIVIIQGNVKKFLTFHNGSNFDYHFIIKELAKEFKEQFSCLGETKEKYITFRVPIEKEVTRIDKNEEEITKNISYMLQFIDSARFMASLLSNLVSNKFERLHRIKCKLGRDDKKCETCEIRYKYCHCFPEYTNFKDDLIEYKCLICNNNCRRNFDQKLKERFSNTYKFSNNNNKFILLLLKGVSPYECMGDWEKLNEVSLSGKEDFYGHLITEDITDAEYVHTERVLK